MTNNIMSQITEKDLIDFGMVKDLDNPYFPFTKVLSVDTQLSAEIDDDDDDDDEINGSEEEISLSIYTGNNQKEFVLNLPDGMVYLGITSIEDLKFIEKMVLGYEPNY